MTALILIGLVIRVRDQLHDDWLGPNLRRNMFLLIALGSVLSVPFNAGKIALASFIAFAISESLDAVVYHKLLRREPLIRINGSNLFSAAADSVAFPALAFGWPLQWGIMVAQFGVKVIGGAAWSILLKQRR